MNAPATLLVVQDLTTSKAFYLDVLGLTLIEDNNDAIKMQIGSHDVYMFQGTMHATEYQHGYSANSTLVFNVMNLDAEITRLKQQGIEFIHKTPNANKWGRYAAFKDPSGIVHELMEFNI